MKNVSILTEQNRRGLDVDSTWPSFYPTATTLITCQGNHGRPNIIPVSSATVVNRFPYMIGVGIARARYSDEYVRRYSHRLIQESGEFVVNIPHAGLADAVRICGQVSGREIDKFEAARLTPGKPVWGQTPLIEECPINLECEVRQMITLGSHDLFIGEVMAVHVDPAYTFVNDGEVIGEGRGSHLLWETLARIDGR